MPTDDIVDKLRGLGFRASPAALRAYFDHAAHSRLGAVEACVFPSAVDEAVKTDLDPAA